MKNVLKRQNEVAMENITLDNIITVSSNHFKLFFCVTPTTTSVTGQKIASHCHSRIRNNNDLRTGNIRRPSSRIQRRTKQLIQIINLVVTSYIFFIHWIGVITRNIPYTKITNDHIFLHFLCIGLFSPSRPQALILFTTACCYHLQQPWITNLDAQ